MCGIQREAKKKNINSNITYLSIYIQTYNIDAQTGESSACATALLCGVKARYETLGLDASGRFNNCASAISSKVTSLIDWAHEAGKRNFSSCLTLYLYLRYLNTGYAFQL